MINDLIKISTFVLIFGLMCICIRLNEIGCSMLCFCLLIQEYRIYSWQKLCGSLIADREQLCKFLGKIEKCINSSEEGIK